MLNPDDKMDVSKHSDLASEVCGLALSLDLNERRQSQLFFGNDDYPQTIRKFKTQILPGTHTPVDIFKRRQISQKKAVVKKLIERARSMIEEGSLLASDEIFRD